MHNAGGLTKVDLACRACICQTKDVVTNCMYNFLAKFQQNCLNIENPNRKTPVKLDVKTKKLLASINKSLK